MQYPSINHYCKGFGNCWCNFIFPCFFRRSRSIQRRIIKSRWGFDGVYLVDYFRQKFHSRSRAARCRTCWIRWHRRTSLAGRPRRSERRRRPAPVGSASTERIKRNKIKFCFFPHEIAPKTISLPFFMESSPFSRGCQEFYSISFGPESTTCVLLRS